MSTPEDRVEQDTPVVPEPDADVQVPLEAVDADVVEQATHAGPPEPQAASADVPMEVDAADAAEQSAVVEHDEEEHR